MLPFGEGNILTGIGKSEDSAAQSSTWPFETGAPESFEAVKKDALYPEASHG